MRPTEPDDSSDGERAAPPYQPIACADHERLEYAALTRQWLTLELVDGQASDGQRGDGERGDTVRVLPRDVYTRDHAEWLRADTADGETLCVRLDRLRLPPR